MEVSAHDGDTVTIGDDISDIEKSSKYFPAAGHYLDDSGIQSACGTQTPAHPGNVLPNDCDFGDRLPPQNNVVTWSNCPMSVNTVENSLLSPATPSTGSILGIDSLGDTPIGSHTASSVDLRGNKLPEIDTDEAVTAIPELVKLIDDEDDPVIIYQSSMMVFQLSKSEALDALINSHDMINCIISALARTADPETIRFLSGTLYNMSQIQPGLKAIFIANCVPCLVKLLNSSIESVLFYAITTLHNLLLHQDGAKAVIRQSGCVQKMITLLRKNNIKFLTICTDCLQILAYGHQESKLQILSSGGPMELVNILSVYQYEKLLWTTARVLKVLSVCPANKPAIIAAGGMEALSKHLHSSSSRLVLNCLWALRNLSDSATRLENLRPLLQSLVQLLSSGDMSVVTCVAGIISNLTCNNQVNKTWVHELNGIQALLRVVNQMGVKEDVLEPCICALRHLTSRHSAEESARRSFVHDIDGLLIIAKILYAATAGISPELGLCCPQQFTSWMLVKAMVGLLRNLAMNIDNHHAMRDYDLVKGLYLLLYATYNNTMKHAAPFSGSYSQSSTVIQGVRLEEIIEGICGALHMLAKDPETRSYLVIFKAPNLAASFNAQPGCSALVIFIHLLYSPNEPIQRAAAGLLAEVSQDAVGLEVIASIPSGVQRLEQLTRSSNEAIATYSSASFMRLAERKDSMNNNNNNDSCMFGTPLESLNTPPPHPHPFDIPHHHVLPQQQHVGGPNSATWNYAPSNPENLRASGPGANSLIAMLGPPPRGLDSCYLSHSDTTNYNSLEPTLMYVDNCNAMYALPSSPITNSDRVVLQSNRHNESVPLPSYAPYAGHRSPESLPFAPPSAAGGGVYTNITNEGFVSIQTSGYISPNEAAFSEHNNAATFQSNRSFGLADQQTTLRGASNSNPCQPTNNDNRGRFLPQQRLVPTPGLTSELMSLDDESGWNPDDTDLF